MVQPWRVGRVIVLSALAAAIATAILSVPLISIAESMHLGCTLFSDGQYSDYVCPDGISYAIPVLLLLAVSFDAFLIIGMYRIYRTQTMQARRRAGAYVQRLLAVVLIGQAFVSIPVARLGNYSLLATGGSLLLVAAGIAALVSARMSAFRHATVMILISMLLVALMLPAILLSPFILVLAALPLIAAMLRGGTPAATQVEIVPSRGALPG